MKTKRIKASTILIEQSNPAPTDGRVFESRAECKWHYVLPADAASYAAMMSQASYALHMADARNLTNEQCAAHVLRAIGITAPKKGSK